MRKYIFVAIFCSLVLGKGYSNECEQCNQFGTVSYIYWSANSDGFSQNAFPSSSLHSVAGGTQVIADGFGEIFSVTPEFNSGFKIGWGQWLCCGDWQFYSEWTRLHQKNSYNFTAPSGDIFVLAVTPDNIVGDQVHASWTSNMDLLDFILVRGLCLGKCAVLEPFFGIRAAWFSQTLGLNLTSFPGSTAGLDPYVFNNFSSTGKTENWNLGVRAGTFYEYMLCNCFRIEGKASASLFYTRFTKLRHDGVSSNITTGTVAELGADWRDRYDAVNYAAEAGIGLGWRQDLCCGRYYIDIKATYDFNIFWHQNFLRAIPDSLVHQTAVLPTNLTFHGPTITVAFGF